MHPPGLTTDRPPSTGGPSDGPGPGVDAVLDALMTIGRLVRQRVPGDDLEPGTFWLLRQLAASGPMRLTDLAGSVQLDASTVSRHATQMERLGLVDRTPDPDDRRAQRLAMTPEGRAQLTRTLDSRRTVLRRSLADWDEPDLAHLERLLGRLVADLNTRTDARTAGTEPA